MRRKDQKTGDNHRGHRGAQAIEREASVFLREYEQALAEGWQLDQVVVGDAFHGMASLAPGAKATGDHEHFESEIL